MKNEEKQLEYLKSIKSGGLPPEREARQLAELRGDGNHEVPLPCVAPDPHPFYGSGDLAALQDPPSREGAYTAGIRSLDELLERDRQRAVGVLWG